MADQLPDPPIDAEVDLTDFGFMPLDVRRLRDSKLAASVDGEQFRCAVLLWCAAWHQMPAGSLPDDDVELANLAGFGRMVPQWKKVRAGALYGWTKCSDGRIYHAVVVEKAIEAWVSKLDTRYRRECDRLRKENKRRQENKDPAVRIPSFYQWNSERRDPGNPCDVQRNSSGIPKDVQRNSVVRPADSVLKGQGQGQGDLRDREILPEAARPADASGGKHPTANGTNGLSSNGIHLPAALTYEQAQQLQSAYPAGTYKQTAWITVQKLVDQHMADGIAFERILASFDRYADQCRATNSIGTQYVSSPIKHCDREHPLFDEPFPIPRSKAEAKQDSNIDAGRRWLAEQEAKDATR